MVHEVVINRELVTRAAVQRGMTVEGVLERVGYPDLAPASPGLIAKLQALLRLGLTDLCQIVSAGHVAPF